MFNILQRLLYVLSVPVLLSILGVLFLIDTLIKLVPGSVIGVLKGHNYKLKPKLAMDFLAIHDILYGKGIENMHGPDINSMYPESMTEEPGDEEDHE